MASTYLNFFSIFYDKNHFWNPHIRFFFFFNLKFHFSWILFFSFILKLFFTFQSTNLCVCVLKTTNFSLFQL